MTIRDARLATKTTITAALLLTGMALAPSPVGASTVSQGALSTTCGPKSVTQQPAPGVGKEATYTVDSAGTVTLFQDSTTKLKVTNVAADAGWKDVVITPAGTRPHVGFQRIGLPNDQERFWARLNTTGTPGTVMNVVLQSCT